MPARSPHSDIEIPSVGVWDFLFTEKKPFPGTKPLFVNPDSGRSYSYTQLKQKTANFGEGLRQRWKWQRTDVLAVFSPNSIDMPVVIWGVHYAGGIVTTANPGYTVDELAFQLKNSGAKALVTQQAMLDTALKACQRAGIPKSRILLLGDIGGHSSEFAHFTTITSASNTSEFNPVKIKNPEQDLAFIVYSSGTTGHPKGVMLSHRNIISATLMTASVESLHLSWKPQPNRPNGDSILAFLPFFHIYGLTVILHQCVLSGFTCVVMPKFDIEGWCRIVQDHKITYSYVVPPLVLQLVKDPVVAKYDLSSIHMLSSGAAPLTPDLVHALWAKKKIRCKQAYGLSETSPSTHFQRWDEWDVATGSVGKLLPNQIAKYMSPEEEEVAVGEVGELWVSGPNIFLGYLNNPEGTKNALTHDGFFRTGDVGYQDKNGNFYITDRVKELIKYKGFQVPPAELEGLLAAHPKIKDVAVVGVQRDDLATEVPLAFVVPDQGATAGPELEREIVDWLAEKVANHKRLRGGVNFIDEIPKSASGKILRRILKDKAGKERDGQKNFIPAKL